MGFDDVLTSADLAASGVVGGPGPVRSVGERGSEAYVLPFEFTVSDVASDEGPPVVDVEPSLGATDPEQAHAARAALTAPLAADDPHGKPLWASDLKDVRSVRSLAADQSGTT
ncbi:hypothetical protein CUD01_16580 [Cellulomonas uda]|uniref:Uncharacterized protein n=1 Tax=Cellulomonas uda TaxID=1714 RepID=A0A4Y3KCU4_CELUD|nr:hypothetical protein CUD01_16580 [Cellulomonas uda]